MTAQTLGGFFRQFRKDRGITLEAATAGAGCSPAALSRFERDQNDLSVATVGRLLANLQLTAHDFLAYTRARPGAMTHDALAAFIAGDVAGLTAQQAAFAKAHPRPTTPAAAYTALVYRLALAPAASSVALTTAQEQLLAQFLVPGPGWHSVHTLGLAAGVRFGSFELLAALAERFINYAAGFDATNIAQSAVNASDFAWLALPLLATRHPQAQAVVAAMTRYHRLRRDLRQVGVIGVSTLNSAPIVTAVQTMAAALEAAGTATGKRHRPHRRQC
ncbi:helix-turn-helix domain-containing protein [Lacticaseibacillus suihuaensis]